MYLDLTGVLFTLHMGVSLNAGTPKWMVYNGKPYEQMDDLGGKPTIFGNTYIGARPIKKTQCFWTRPLLGVDPYPLVIWCYRAYPPGRRRGTFPARLPAPRWGMESMEKAWKNAWNMEIWPMIYIYMYISYILDLCFVGCGRPTFLIHDGKNKGGWWWALLFPISGGSFSEQSRNRTKWAATSYKWGQNLYIYICPY